MATNISDQAAVDPRAQLGEDVEIGPFCMVGPDVTIGAGCRLMNNVTLTGRVTVGENNQFFPGVVIGAGLGDSARAAIVTRGFAEMTRFATALGARSETLTGLSGLGDLILTCTSPQSRNFRFGQAMGRGEDFDPTITVEGAATARAVSALASREGTDMPIAGMVAALASGAVSVEKAADILMNRPLKEE